MQAQSVDPGNSSEAAVAAKPPLVPDGEDKETLRRIGLIVTAVTLLTLGLVAISLTFG